MKETKFKQTEVGMIPWDWDLLSLSKIGSFSKGSGISRDESNSGKIPAIRYGEIYTKHNDYIREFYSHISKEVAQTSIKIETGDILFSASGETKEDIGKAVAFLGTDEAYAGGDIIIMSPKINIESMFLGYVLNFPDVAKQKATKAQGDAVVHITTDSLKKLNVPVPEYKEQQRIANALSDVDTLISNLEKLIAKKKNIKQGAMQQLLTGRKRLPGFAPSCHPERSTKCAVEGSSHFKMTELGPIPEDWVVKTINNVGKIVGGGTPSTFNPAYWNGPIQWFTPAELSKAGKYVSKSERTITKLGVDDCSAKMLPPGTILITTRASIGTSVILMAPACTNQGFQSLVVNDENSNEFLYYLLSTKVDEMLSLASGSTFLEISPKKLGGILLQMPSSKAEQTAIANVLSDMDSEIQTLETKLAKYRKLKTGMMQQLLTGKIRLV